MDDVHGAMAGLLVNGRPREEVDAAFAAMVERQARLMFRVASTVLRRSEDAEDAVQEAFLRMYRSAGWRGVREEKAYVARVVWRVAVDRATATRRRREDGEVDGMELAAGGDGAEMLLERAGEQDRLRRLMEGLPETLRRPLVLCAIEEMGSREVAVVLGIPEGTVRRRVMRAKEELRRRFAAGERGGTR